MAHQVNAQISGLLILGVFGVLFWIFEVVTEKQIVAKSFSVDG